MASSCFSKRNTGKFRSLVTAAAFPWLHSLGVLPIHDVRPGASEIDTAADRLLHFHNTEYEEFAKSWALLFVGVGIIYLCRPRGVFKKGPKRRSD